MRFNHQRLTKSMRSIRLLTLLSILAIVYFGFQITFDALIVLIPFVVLAILYAVPIFPNKKNLRNIGVVKIFIIAMVWTGTTVLVPIIDAGAAIEYDVFIEMTQRFLFIVVMMLPFEVRDMQFDDKSMETIPQKIGITRTKVFGSLLLVFFLLLVAVKDEISSLDILSTIMVTTISLFFLWGTEKKQSEYYCSFWVESIPIMWWITGLGLKFLFQ